MDSIWRQILFCLVLSFLLFFGFIIMVMVFKSIAGKNDDSGK